jgi:alpha-beta hydrolase superfamily lysophospholipase
MHERVTFTTSDGVEIVGDWYPVPNAKKFAILLHMRPSTKESWREWANELQNRGVACLAYDQRGHGESTMDGKLDYETMSEEESRAKKLDLEAAWKFLKSKHANEEHLVLWGASIGANLAIRFAAEHPRVRDVVALSPGLSYRGVTTDDAILKLTQDQRVILIASDDDAHHSLESCEELHRMAPGQTILIKKTKAGHGTDMLERDATLFYDMLTALDV